MSISSETARRNVRAGKVTETMVANYLTEALGLADEVRIVRAVRTGSSAAADPGDLARLTGLLCSVKYASVKPSDGRVRTYVTEWMAELDAMEGTGDEVRFLVVRLPKIQIANWPVYTRCGVLASMMTAAGFGFGPDLPGGPKVLIPWARRVRAPYASRHITTPVMLPLEAWALMLRDAGFGRAPRADDQVGPID